VKASDSVIAIGEKWRERQIYLHALESEVDKLGENKYKEEFESSDSRGPSEHDEKAIEVPRDPLRNADSRFARLSRQI
jgi:hypothetical protein